MAFFLKRAIGIGFLFVALPFGHAMAEVYNPRNYDEDEAAARSQVQKACKKAKNHMRCFLDETEKMEAAGRMRGTQAYVDKHYKPLATDSLVAKYRELEDLRTTARTSTLNHKPGEVLFSDYDNEMKMVSAEYKKRTGKPILLKGRCAGIKATLGVENNELIQKLMDCKD